MPREEVPLGAWWPAQSYGAWRPRSARLARAKGQGRLQTDFRAQNSIAGKTPEKGFAGNITALVGPLGAPCS
ncbi:hypothetical protein MUN81_05535 [Hymenobacter sp. 5317J-9]|uniref:hypothetical protein n=1 Tax=Hymenobacter sp. 5317J-9 TaxID=2932250 RepID=UPI001FD70C53|nr:hypothetical protein [Hymenobacter sp. 5317J-9]UOQ98953.1 hypothetical protein MUN81_05535 [Hymenobacter sp. 5317J-9]